MNQHKRRPVPTGAQRRTRASWVFISVRNLTTVCSSSGWKWERAASVDCVRERKHSRAAARAVAALAGQRGIQARPSPAVCSEDGRALQAVVPLAPDLGEQLPSVLAEGVRRPDRWRGWACRSLVPLRHFSGIDGLLLLVYRSLLLPLLIIISAVFALSPARAVVYAPADRAIVRVDGQVQGTPTRMATNCRPTRRRQADSGSAVSWAVETEGARRPRPEERGAASEERCGAAPRPWRRVRRTGRLPVRRRSQFLVRVQV
ncbi:MMPL family transporter [Streptomyces racemochromogenes]|uniref:MMPL family transporter n=1 Tax=Streptomyces racemochromogenes TaxID=67353 RepID=A0ABW7PG71_9ACTN